MHKNNDNAEEKPTGSRVMRVKVFDEKVSCEAKRWRSKKGGEAKKEQNRATALSEFLSLFRLASH